MQHRDKIIVKADSRDIQIANGVIIPDKEDIGVICVGKNRLDILTSFCSATIYRLLTKKPPQQNFQKDTNKSIQYLLYTKGNVEPGETNGVIFGQCQKTNEYIILTSKDPISKKEVFGLMNKAILQLETLLEFSNWSEKEFIVFLNNFAAQMSSSDICGSENEVAYMIRETGIKKYERKYRFKFTCHVANSAMEQLMEDFNLSQDDFDEMSKDEKDGGPFYIEEDALPKFIIGDDTGADNKEGIMKANGAPQRRSTKRREFQMSLAAQLFFSGTHAVICKSAKDFYKIKELAYSTNLGNFEDINDMAWKYFKYIYVNENRRIKATNQFKKTGCEGIVNIKKL